MQQQTALVLGATGLIGQHVVKQLLADNSFNKVRILVRKDYAVQHEKLDVVTVDFNNLAEYKNKIGIGDVVFSCVGTTMKKMNGDKVAYRKVDFDIPVNAAKFCADTGYNKFLLVSSVGANASSNNFYLKLKGEVEDAIKQTQFKSIGIFQPSMLLGDRKEFRLGELIGKGVMTVVSPLMVGGMKKYRAISSADVAKAMVAAAKSDQGGTQTFTYEEMIHLAKN